MLAAAAAAQPDAQPDARQTLLTVTVSADTVTIGEPFTVRVRVRAPKVATIRFPEVPAAAEGMDPVDPRAIEEGPPSDVADRTAIYSFVAWDIGPRAPVFAPVTVIVAGRTREFAVTVPAIVVQSLLPADSTEHVPRDARAPVPLPGRLWQYLFLGAVLLGGLVWFWLRHRQRAKAGKDVPDPDAWAEARTAWAALDLLALHEAGEPGRHVIAHVDVLRSYLARRFPPVGLTLNAGQAAAVLSQLDFPVPVPRVADLLARDADLRFAQQPVSGDEAAALAAEARDITAQVQLAHEARLRAVERPPRPRRR